MTTTEPAAKPVESPVESDVIGCGAHDDELTRAVRETLDRVGSKWTMLVIGVLRDGPLRFGELLEQIPGLSQRMLTRTLRQLERDGMVSREVFAEVPPRVVYTLSTLGETLIEPAMTLVRWTLEHHEQIASSRELYDGR